MESPVDAPLARVLLRTLDELAIAVAVLTRDRRVLALNAAAQALSRERKEVKVERDRLRLVRREDDGELARCVAEARADRDVVFAARRGRSALQAVVRALLVASTDVVLVHFIHARRCDAELLPRLFGFSPAEARVAIEAIHGATATGIAQKLSLSVHTVRSHLKQIFVKTGAATRAELVRLLIAAAGTLRPHS